MRPGFGYFPLIFDQAARDQMVVSGTDQTATTEASGRTASAGRWVYLPEDVARQHPLYGVFGWALILLAFLFAAPLALVVQDIRLLWGGHRIPTQFWFVLGLDVVLLGAAWVAALKLGREQASFLPHFLLAALIGLGSAALFFMVMTAGVPPEYQDRGSFGLVLRGLPVVLWIAYVLFSRRISVTIRKRVHAEDPFLRAQWMTDRPTGLRPTGARGTVYARPYRTQPLEHPPADADAEEGAAATPSVEQQPSQAAAPAAVEHTTPVPHQGRPVYPPVTTQTTVRPPGPPSSMPVPVAAGRPSVPPPPRMPGFGESAGGDASQHKRWENSLVLDRLRRLQIAHDEGLISSSELQAKREEILREL
ncbi:hypothetical protein ABIE65_002857 [Constrictibacter sp. MBR-5]|jgi:hypothetical protein